MSAPNVASPAARSREPKSHFAFVARRVVVLVAAAAGLFGILSGQPILSVAWRAAAVALVGAALIHVSERVLGRTRTDATPRTRGGVR